MRNAVEKKKTEARSAGLGSGAARDSDHHHHHHLDAATSCGDKYASSDSYPEDGDLAALIDALSTHIDGDSLQEVAVQ